MDKRNPEVLVDKTGDELGKVTDVIPNPRNLEPEWIVVKPGRFASEHLVPVAVLEHRDHDYVAPFDAEMLKSAPPAEKHTPPTDHEREMAYAHFGLEAPS